MYKVISANRSSHKAPKNWRVFEQENLEKLKKRFKEIGFELITNDLT